MLMGRMIEVNALAIQSDGKIVTAGAVCCNEFFDAEFRVARLRPRGRLDGTFGRDGLTDASMSTYNGFLDAALQPDGRIVAVGGWLGHGAITARYRA